MLGTIRLVVLARFLVLVSTVAGTATSVTIVDLLVGDLGLVTFSVSGVFNNLPSAIRKKNVVSALGYISLTLFFVSEVVARSWVFYFVFELVVSWFSSVFVASVAVSSVARRQVVVGGRSILVAWSDYCLGLGWSSIAAAWWAILVAWWAVLVAWWTVLVAGWTILVGW